MIDICFICSSKSFLRKTAHYYECDNCNHQYAYFINQEYIINNALDDNEYFKETDLLKFQKNVALNSSTKKELLVDIGAANGYFIYHAKEYFKKVVGIEITKECIEYARNKGLEIHESIAGVDSELDVVSFWHSLEHIPVDHISGILQEIKNNSNEKTKLVISVPNNFTLVDKINHNANAYLDLHSHIHQFSFKSLNLLMGKYGFTLEKNVFSISYTLFGYLQFILNLLIKPHNYFYYRKKRQNTFGFSNKKLVFYDFLSYLILIALGPFAVFGVIYDFVFKKSRMVITLVYKRRES